MLIILEDKDFNNHRCITEHGASCIKFDLWSIIHISDFVIYKMEENGKEIVNILKNRASGTIENNVPFANFLDFFVYLVVKVYDRIK